MNFLPMLAGNIVGGYLMGQNQREQKMQERELALKEQALKQKLYDAQIKAKEIEAKRDEKIDNLIQQYTQMQNQQGAASAAEQRPGLGFDESFDSGTKQPSQLPSALASMDPIIAALIKKSWGVDMLGAMNYQRQQDQWAGTEQRQWTELALREKDREAQREQSAGAVNYIKRIGPDNAEYYVPVPSNPQAYNKYYGGGKPGLGAKPPALGAKPPGLGATSGGGIPSKPPAADLPIESDESYLWRHPEGKKLPVGITPKVAESAGFVRFGATDVTKLDQLQVGLDALDEIENLMLAADIPKTGESSKLPGLRRKGMATLQWGREGQALAKLESYILGNKASLARLGGDVGNMTESEQEDVKEYLGKITDAGPKAWESFNLVKKKFRKIKDRKFGIQEADLRWNPSTNRLEPIK